MTASEDRFESPSTQEIDPALKRTFWVAVLEANVALVALALGGLMIVVAGWIPIGVTALLAGGLVGIDLWRRVRNRPTGTDR